MGAADPQVMERVRAEGRVLLTMDKGIANVRRYHPVGMRVSFCSVRHRLDVARFSHSPGVIYLQFSKWN
jgi:hypothetical protein